MPPTGARRQRPPARRGNAAVVTGPYGALLKPPATPGDLYLRRVREPTACPFAVFPDNLGTFPKTAVFGTRIGAI